MIEKITDAYVRHYRDNGQVIAYVEWVDHKGKRGRTEGEATRIGVLASTWARYSLARNVNSAASQDLSAGNSRRPDLHT